MNGDGCSETCGLEEGFSCLPLPCHTTLCTNISGINQVAGVEDLVCFQENSGELLLRWSHAHLDFVTLFEVNCEYGLDSHAYVLNMSTSACSDYVCENSQEHLQPGLRVRCSVRAMTANVGWSPSLSCQTYVLGYPSAPLHPVITHSATASYLNTRWCVAWNAPADHGDGKGAEAEDRTPIIGYEIEIECGGSKYAWQTSNVLSTCIIADWKDNENAWACDSQAVPEEFELVGPYSTTNLICSRGDILSFKTRAKNLFITGNWSVASSIPVMGLPARPLQLSVDEVSNGLSVHWTEVSIVSLQCAIESDVVCIAA